MKNNKKARTYLVLGVITLFILVVTSSFAYFQFQGGDDARTNINVATNTTDLLQFKIDKGISIHATQENFSQGKGSLSDTTTASAVLRPNNKTNSATGRYNIYFVIDRNDYIYTSKNNNAELLLNITDPTGKRVENITGLINTGNGFDITTRTGSFLIVADYDIAANNKETTQNWQVEVTFVNLDSDQSANAGKKLSGNIYITKDQLSTYELAEISKMTISATHDSITAVAEVTPGSSKIDKYYFASEEVTTPTAYKNNNIKLLANTNDELTYVASDTPNYKFTNLKDNSTYKIYSYAEDVNGIKSNIYETEVITDTYVLPVINSVRHQTTLNSITLNVDAIKGSNNIVSYLYSKDNGLTYEESTSNTYTFNNLNDTTEYKIKVKVKDSAGRYSTEYYEAIETTTYILPVVTNVKSTTTYNSITLNVTGTNGTNTITRYKYSINNEPYQESSNATYTFNGLNDNTNYTVRVVAVDTKDRESVVYTTSVTTDAYNLPVINNVTLDSTANSITINVSGTNGDGTITEYYYSKDGGSTYTKTLSSSYTFSGLTGLTTFYIKVYVKDNNGKESSIWSNSIATKEPLLTEYIKNLYTNQGVNNLYLHDETLVNGANDGSYRYSGSDYKLTDRAKNEGYTIIFNGLFKKANNSNMKVTIAYDTENVEYTIDDAINKAVLDGYIIKNNINNYVCFGSDTTPCPEDNLYRIIGVFGNQVKLIKSNYESTVSGQWGFKACGNGGGGEVDEIVPTSNIIAAPEIGMCGTDIWNFANINEKLNNMFYNNFSQNWQDKIAVSNWSIYGIEYDKLMMDNKTIYDYEVGKLSYKGNYEDMCWEENRNYYCTLNSPYQEKMGLMYLSDFLYAKDINTWDIKNNQDNWMYSPFNNYWTITRTTGKLNKGHIIRIDDLANIDVIQPGIPSSGAHAKPTFYLNSNVTYASGSGTQNDPIIIN